MKRTFMKTCIAAGIGLMMGGAVMAQTTLKVATPTPEKGWFGDIHKWWGQEVEKRSNGEIKVQFFWANSLVKWQDCLPAMQSGITDMCWVSSSYHPANLANYMILDNLLNYGDDYVAAVKAAIDTVEQQPDMAAEMKREDIVKMMSQPARSVRLSTTFAPYSFRGSAFDFVRFQTDRSQPTFASLAAIA